MKLKRQPAPELSTETISVLLGGWTKRPPEPCDQGFDGGMLDLFEGDAMIRQMWTAHETYLRATARRWGWKPRFIGSDGQRRYYGEHIAAGNPAFGSAVDGDDDDDV